MHMRVSNVNLWWDHIDSLDLCSRYGVKTRAPQIEDWGLVTSVVIPPGYFGGSPKHRRAIRLSDLKGTSPCPLCGPPYEPASADDEQGQEHPFINPRGNDPQHERGDDHREIIRSRVAAVSAIAPPRIQNAGRTDPDEGDDPDHGANGCRNKQKHMHGNPFGRRDGAKRPLTGESIIRVIGRKPTA